jgi:hypothetical protein
MASLNHKPIEIMFHGICRQILYLIVAIEAPIVVRSTRRITRSEPESYLDNADDILRGNAGHSEFRGYVFSSAL